MNIEIIPKIGDKTLKKLNKKGIFTFIDLISFYPINYQLYKSESLYKINTNSNVLLEGVIVRGISEYKVRNNLSITNYFISNGIDEIKVVAFNQRHLRFTLKVGQRVKILGKFDVNKNQIVQKKIDIIEEKSSSYKELSDKTNKILPIYSKITGLSDKQIQNVILEAINFIDDQDYKDNLNKIHNPQNTEDINNAYEYLKYKEFFDYYTKLNRLKKKQNLICKSYNKNVSINNLNKILNTLPFSLTKDQETCINSLIKSLNSDCKTQSLILGDVGSGKTIVSILLSYLLIKKDYQVCIMAPTEVLAKQLYANFKMFLSEDEESICLLTSSLKKIEKNRLKDNLLVGVYKIAIGTHALIEDDVVFKNLAVCIIDEQHRFGVEQRNKLINKTLYKEFVYLSATPIPRTLAQSIFGIYDVLFIETKPKNRKKVITNIYDNKTKKEIYEIIDVELQKQNQVYIVAPLIEKNEILNLSDVQTLYERISKLYENKYNVGLLHGSQKSKDKEIIMQKFKSHEYNILIATTVIEVGVDVPDATVILIVNAERFGLAQLHQLRGRVGRSQKQSYCLLLDKSNNELSKKRLKLLQTNDNGFELANKDMELRGYGNFFGKEQSGFSEFKIFDYTEDMNIAQQVIENFNKK